MLLSLMRKHAKSWLIKFLIAIIAVVFIFYFGYSLKSGRETRVAYVNGELISRDEYQKTYREVLNQYRRNNKSGWNDEMIRKLDLPGQALEKAIDRKAFRLSAQFFITYAFLVSFISFFVVGGKGNIPVYYLPVFLVIGLFLSQLVQSAVILVLFSLEEQDGD